MALTRPTGNDPHEVEEIIPTVCPNGHILGPGTVLIHGNVERRHVRCRTCGLEMTSRHGSDQWTTEQKEPG